MADKFEDLPIYKDAHKLVLMIYKITKNFPREEAYGLSSQIRRSSSSVVANIIEGNSRGHKKEFLQFLYVAKGSLEETKYHLILAKDLNYVVNEFYEEIHTQCELVGKQLNGLIKYLKK